VLASIAPDGTGMLRYEDRDVVPGTRYAYRLSYDDAGTAAHSGQTWIEVPARYELALAGLTPNPATGSDLRVSFTLPGRASGRLELLDVTGRRLAAQPLDAFEPGPHVIRLDPAAGVPAGIYWMRLHHDGRVVTRRGAVIR
jgi:hypothetical protein